MKYLIIIILIGIAIYYAMKWQRPSKGKSDDQKNTNTSNNSYSGTGSYSNNANKRKHGGSSYAKWVGGGLGWAFGGPIGGILGFMFGSMFDGMQSGKYEYGKTQTGDFAVSLLVLTAAVMKADGTARKSELNYVKRFYENNFGVERAGQYIKMLGELLKQELDVRQVGAQIGQFMDYSSRMMLLQYLFGISQADGNYHPKEVEMVRVISGYMGIGQKDYESIKAMFIKDTGSAYQILEVSPDVTDEELKKAYRELAKKHHPDKVSHLGEEVKKAAEEKFTKLNAAYEAIKKERGLK
jgi:DnaJ like chaperone protein